MTRNSPSVNRSDDTTPPVRRGRRSCAVACGAALLALLMCGFPAAAQVTYTWFATPDTGTPNWAVGTNWSPNSGPMTGDSVLFNVPGTIANTLNDIPGGISLNTLTITATAPAM